MDFDSLNEIMATGWLKTTNGWKDRGNQQLINPDEGNEQMRKKHIENTIHGVSSSRDSFFL